VFGRFVTTEYTTIDRHGQPITWPVIPFYRRGGPCIDVSTALGTPKKADDAVANPRVALLFSDPTGSGLSDPPAVLVQGLADVDDRDLRANRERYMRESLEKLPGLTAQQPPSLLTRSGLVDWYYERIFVHVHPQRVCVWPRGKISAAPEVFEARVSEIHASEHEPDRAEVELVDPEGVWDSRIDELADRFSTVVLSIVGGNGFPLSARVPVRIDSAKPWVWLESEPAGIQLAPGRACLTAHRHVADPSAKWWQRNIQVRGDLAYQQSHWVLVPRKLIGGFEVSASPAVTAARNLRRIWRFQRTARREHARRSARPTAGSR
jgi:hypothetical protein